MMNRPDLTELTDEQLIAAGNRGLLKRAQQELTTQTMTSLHVDANGLVLEWSDGVRCEFPPGSSIRGARCSCAAPSVCRHLLRSVLYLRAEAVPATTVKPAPAAADPLTMSDTELAKAFGKAALTKARKQLAEELTIASSDVESRTVEFSSIGVTTQFPKGADLPGTICSCKEPYPCPHLLPALLWLRGERPAAAKKATEEQEISRDAAVARLSRLLTELMRAGLDGLSQGWREAAFALTLELDKAGLAKPARLLQSLAGLVAADSERIGDVDPGQIRWTLAALWLRVFASTRSSPGTAEAARTTDTEKFNDDDLLTDTSARFWSSGRKRLLGLTCSAWWTEDLVGLTLFLQDEETGEIVTVGTARPSDRGQTAVNLAAGVPIFGSFTTRDLLGRRIECSSTRRAEGKLRLGEGATCNLLPDPVDWQSLIETQAIRTFAAIGSRFEESFPTIASLGRRDLFLFEPAEWKVAEFRTDLQLFRWPMVDRDDRTAPLILRYREEHGASIRDLVQLSKVEQPAALLGRATLSGHGLSIRPLILFLEKEGGLQPYHIDVDRYQNGKKISSKRSRGVVF